MKNNLNKLSLILFLLVISAIPLLAQTEGNEDELGSVIKTVIAITAFLIAFILWLVFAFAEKEDLEGKNALQLQEIWNRINRTAPVEEEHKILLDHEYDGIRELDNKIPPWFNAILWGTIIWAFIYMINYHVIGSGNVQEDEYLEEVRLATLQREMITASGGLVNEDNVTKLTDDIALVSGEEIFVKSCAACHGMMGEGLVGPNFTDDNWIHGGGIKNLFKIIKYGVPTKGMISWESQLNPTQMQEVASYILTLRGTNPPNQKGPEGDKWDPSLEEADDLSVSLNDKGIGSITKVELNEIDPAIAKKGEELFVSKCSACHKVDKRFVGPALKGVTERRSPEWIMNMILDPDKMVKENKAAKDLLAEYLAPMANQSLSEDEARTILEYLRTLTPSK